MPLLFWRLEWLIQLSINQLGLILLHIISFAKYVMLKTGIFASRYQGGLTRNGVKVIIKRATHLWALAQLDRKIASKQCCQERSDIFGFSNFDGGNLFVTCPLKHVMGMNNTVSGSKATNAITSQWDESKGFFAPLWAVENWYPGAPPSHRVFLFRFKTLVFTCIRSICPSTWATISMVSRFTISQATPIFISVTIQICSPIFPVSRLVLILPPMEYEIYFLTVPQ